MIYNFLSLCYEYLGGEGNIMTEIRGQSRIILSKISIISTTLIKILIIISNQDCHLQGSRSSRAGQRARSVLQARVITSDFSGNPKKETHKSNQKTTTPPISPCSRFCEQGTLKFRIIKLLMSFIVIILQVIIIRVL